MFARWIGDAVSAKMIPCGMSSFKPLRCIPSSLNHLLNRLTKGSIPLTRRLELFVFDWAFFGRIPA